MPSMQRAMSAYGLAAETLPPARQIVLLCDGAIRRIKEARRALERGRINDRYIAVHKAAAIVDALHACLDYERGGEIARRLDQIYTYVGFRLHRINLNGDVAICDELVLRLGELRTSWVQIAEFGSARVGAHPTAAPVGVRPAAPGSVVTI